MTAQYTTQHLLRGVVRRMLEVERINYATSSKFDLIGGGDVAAETAAEESAIVDEVVDAVRTWNFKAHLTIEECTRLERINQLLAKLCRHESVTTKNLRDVLTQSEYEDYERSLAEPVTSVEVLYEDGVPTELRKYNSMLNKADFKYNRFEKMSALKRLGAARYSSESIERAHNGAVHLYELAREYLSEQIALDEINRQGDRLERWLDRSVNFEIDGAISLDPIGMPRVKGSRSHNALDAALPKMSQRLKREQRMLENLLRAAVVCAYEAAVEEAEEQTPVKVPKRIDFAALHPERD